MAEVSVPSRGLGSFLQMKKIEIDPKEIMFPSPREAWVISYDKSGKEGELIWQTFPAPREVWVVSYSEDWNE